MFKTIILRRQAKMLFLVTFITFITWIPSVFAYAIGDSTVSASEENNSVNHLEGIKLLYVQYIFFINHASNPVSYHVYGLINQRFRKDCQSLLQKICSKL